ncbi:MAG: Gfo/Idh/MocA family oxidoreductase [Dehalococcoidales bacterium]
MLSSEKCAGTGLDKIQVCVIGGGRWGENHIKTLSGLGNLAGVVESNQERLKELEDKYFVQGYPTIDKALKVGFDGYTVATPAPTHYEIGKRLLELGQNVLIEKPLTLSSEQAKDLVEIANTTKSKLMVGHLLLFHPAIRKVKELLDEDKIGKIHYIYSTRLNFGTLRTAESVFWSFAPHDVSVLNFLVGNPPIKIEAKGSKYLQEDVFDVTMAQFTYPDNVKGHIFVSWLHPFKEQRLVVIGSKGMLSYEDTVGEKEIKYYEKHFEIAGQQVLKHENPTEVVPYEEAPPLSEEMKYFIECIGTDANIETADGNSGYQVVKVLEEVDKILWNSEI